MQMTRRSILHLAGAAMCAAAVPAGVALGAQTAQAATGDLMWIASDGRVHTYDERGRVKVYGSDGIWRICPQYATHGYAGRPATEAELEDAGYLG